MRELESAPSEGRGALEASDRTPLAIELRALSKSFGATQILKGVDAQVPEGSLTALMGPSGTGKSVLIRHVIGLLEPDAGDVYVHGSRLGEMSRGELLRLRRRVGLMFQDGALFSFLNVFDNVAFPLRQHTDLRESEVRDVVAQQLAAVGLAGAATRFPSELSGGMKKRAGLARALVLNPRIVLCDEPDSGLDPVRTALLGELLVDRMRELGGTMLVVTHNVALAKLVADHVIVLWKGRVLASGPAEQMWESEDPFIRQFITGGAQGPLGMDN